MGNNLRLNSDNVGLRITPTVTSEAAGFEVRHAFDGNRHSFWKATSAVEQQITFDAGVGNTITSDYVAIARADLLVNVAAQISVQTSTDMSVWNNVTGGGFPDTLVAGDLRKPADTDYYQEYDSTTARGLRLRIHGTLTGAPMLAELALGVRREVTLNPSPGRRYGVARAHAGALWSITFDNRVSEAQAQALMDYLKAISPAHPAERPLVTTAGAVYGGLAHWLYDPTGFLVRYAIAATPALLHVICLNPDQLEHQLFRDQHTVGPLEYHQLV